MNRSMQVSAIFTIILLVSSSFGVTSAGQDVVGTVMAEEKDPDPQVEVKVYALKECSIICLDDAHSNTPRVVFETKTDQMGRFRVPDGTPPFQAIIATKKEYGPNWLVFDGAPPESPRIIVHRAGSLKTRLVDTSGKPMRGVTVFAQPAGVERAIALRHEVRTTTNDAGEFLFEGLAPRSYELQIQSQTHILPDRYTITIDPAETSGPSEISAPLAYSVSGQVIDFRSGKPIAGALVWTSVSPWAEQTKTDAEGRYSLKRLAPGWHVLHVGAVDLNYVSVEQGAQENVGYPGTLQLLVRDKSLEKMNIRLRQGCEISGIIVNKEKKPLKGYIIYLNNNEPQLSTLVRRRRAVSNEQGRFAFRGVPVGDNFYCRINPPGVESGGETVEFSTAVFNLDLESSPKRLNITVDETTKTLK